MKKRVLILCTHNSSRSQMAEGLLRAAGGGNIEVESAGTEATRVHPLAVKAMAERGIDITGHTSKTLDRFLDQPWDDVITVCDSANETCPVFPKAGRRIHWSFEDPSKAAGTEDERLAKFRRIRDQIEAKFKAWLGEQR
jgi:arsenate reductase (thioredoxin)